MSEVSTKVSLDGGGYTRIVFEDGLTESGICLTNFAARTLRDQLTEALGDDKPTPAPFKDNARFVDIRKGDLVRYQKTYGDGSFEVREGIIDHLVDDEAWFTRNSNIIVGEFNDAPNEVVTIISRPEPAWEGGDLALDADGYLWVYDGDTWECLRYGKGAAKWTSADLVDRFGPIARAKVVAADD